MARNKRRKPGEQPTITPAQGSEWLRSPQSDPLRDEASRRARTVVENEDEDETETGERSSPSGPEV